MYIMQNIIGKLILSVIFLIICFIYVGFYFASGNIHINEVMYDINGTDTDHEWLEVYNSGVYKIFDLENSTLLASTFCY